MLTYLLIAVGVVLALVISTAVVLAVRPQLAAALFMRIPWLQRKALETVAGNPDLLGRAMESDALPPGADQAAMRRLQSQLTAMTPEQRQATITAAQAGDTAAIKEQLQEAPSATAVAQRSRQQAKKKAKARAARKRARTQRR